MPRAHVLAVAALAAACSARENRVVVAEASADARAVAVTLDGAGRPISADGPFALAAPPTFLLAEGAAALVVFALEPSDYVALDGAPVGDDAWAGLEVVLAAQAPGCGCAAPRDLVPAVVAPGDECSPPSFARWALRYVGGSPGDGDDISLVDAARRGVRLRWPGRCDHQRLPLAARRASIEPLCPWLPSDDPRHPAVTAAAPGGTIGGLSTTGAWWSTSAADGTRREGVLSIEDARVQDMVAADGGRWIVRTAPATGTGRPRLRLLDAALQEIASVTPSQLMVRGLDALWAQGSVEAWVFGTINGLPQVRRCPAQGGIIGCEPQGPLDERCLRSGDAFVGVEAVSGRTLAWTRGGALAAAPREGPLRWRCLGAVDRVHTARGSGEPVAVSEIGAAHGEDDRLWACARSEERTALLTVALPTAPPSDPDFDGVVDRARVELELVDSGPCNGFVRTSTALYALVGRERWRLLPSGVVERSSPTIARGAARAEVAPGGTVTWRDGRGAVHRGLGDGTGALALGTAEDNAGISALTAEEAGFVAWRDGAAPLAIPVPPSPRCDGSRGTPAELLIEGLGAASTLYRWTTTELGDAWALRGDPVTEVVRVDAASRRATTYLWESAAPVAAATVRAIAPLSTGGLVVAQDGGAVLRARVAEGRAIAEPVMFEGWAGGPAPTLPEWTAVRSSVGVAWLAGHGVLARVTAVSAEAADVVTWPLTASEPLLPRDSGYAGLVVLGPSDVWLSTRDSFDNGVFRFTRVVTWQIADANRGCDGPLLGAELRACQQEDSRDNHTLTDRGYAPQVGIGPSYDPLLINGQGLIYGPTGLRGGVGFSDPVHIAQRADGVFAVAGGGGYLTVGARRLTDP